VAERPSFEPFLDIFLEPLPTYLLVARKLVALTSNPKIVAVFRGQLPEYLVAAYRLASLVYPAAAQ
jgi:hypothetical protein